MNDESLFITHLLFYSSKDSNAYLTLTCAECQQKKLVCIINKGLHFGVFATNFWHGFFFLYLPMSSPNKC
jgi:hypothetical protein